MEKKEIYDMVIQELIEKLFQSEEKLAAVMKSSFMKHWKKNQSGPEACWNSCQKKSIRS